MKHRQQIAFEAPAFYFENAGAFHLRKDEPQANSSLTLTTVLCIDAYKGNKIEWHALAALQIAPQKFLKFGELGYDLQKQLVGICLQLLDGVGDQATTRCEWSNYSLHVKRKVTNVERFFIENRRSLIKRIVTPVGHTQLIGREQAIDEFNFDPLNSGIPKLG